MNTVGRKTEKPKRHCLRAAALSLVLTLSFCQLAFAENAAGDGTSVIGGSFGILQTEKYNNLDEDPVLSGGEVRFLCNEGSEAQQLSAVFRSGDGRVVVVDGGLAEDTEHLRSVINEFGGYVDAWLITHPHTDHVGALMKILSEGYVSPQIGAVYYHFFDQEWYDDNDPDECGVPAVLRDLLGRLDPARVHGDIGRGDVIYLSDELYVRVLNDPLKTTGSYAGNGAGIMYDVCIDGKHFIMLGDMSAEAGDEHLADGVLDGIVCDYVQISHHGQRGVSDEFYAALKPQNCIWPTNERIYLAQGVKDSGLGTTRTKLCISKLPVKNNYVTLGRDVVIR